VANATTVDQMGPGDHGCLTFSDPDERLDLVAAFIRDGLRRRQRVLCWTDSLEPDRLSTELAKRSVRGTAAMRRGQLTIASASDWLLGQSDGGGASGMVQVLANELDRTSREGFDGLRVTADMCWATRPSSAAEQLIAFETQVAELFVGGRLCLVCQYDRDRFDGVTLAFTATAHTKTVAAQVYHESPLLRICRQYSPPGVRIAGELDYQHQDVLEQSLAESRRLDRNMLVNLSRLQYIDAACAATIVRAADRLPASRRMTVTCRHLVATILDLVGAPSAPRLQVVADQ
jgi:hypothetical protein